MSPSLYGGKRRWGGFFRVRGLRPFGSPPQAENTPRVQNVKKVAAFVTLRGPSLVDRARTSCFEVAEVGRRKLSTP